MTKTQEKALRAVQHGKHTAEAVATTLKMDPRAARRHLAALVAKGMLTRSFVYERPRGAKQLVGRYVYVEATATVPGDGEGR